MADYTLLTAEDKARIAAEVQARVDADAQVRAAEEAHYRATLEAKAGLIPQAPDPFVPPNVTKLRAAEAALDAYTKVPDVRN